MQRMDELTVIYQWVDLVFEGYKTHPIGIALDLWVQPEN